MPLRKLTGAGTTEIQKYCFKGVSFSIFRKDYLPPAILSPCSGCADVGTMLAHFGAL